MSRAKGYKCFNIKCGSCIGKTLCGEPEDTALVCVDRVIGKPMTNADRIRSMTDEELVELHYSSSAHCIADDPTVCDRHDFIGNLTPCEQCYLKWLQQPAEEDDHDERKENENV